MANVSVLPHSNKVNVTFTKFKHSSSHPVHLSIVSPPGPYSLFNSLLKYLSFRGMSPGPLFIFNNSPVTRKFYTMQLKNCLQWAGLNPQRYKTHSFRIGAATSAITNGHTQEQVQLMGRWRSGAFRKYIRIQSFTT